ncbi:M14 family metallocarboxypeptidase [Comamonas sp. NLF-1-9]|uniref:M14 family metallopeptidase n=1 Tax=Comamonas sp. NLF-1-9 TaxID=2853163 RepID=UPI001C46ABCC|nr:M14 family metallocarboxypeptidase [Comamonas sp. NLF-1-9]QXL83135.1 M14 family metallocarboxypeptidase [Comamonas sp. NLF-1-9]
MKLLIDPRATVRLPSPRPLAALAALLLAACAGTPLPPWPAQQARVVPPPRTVPVGPPQTGMPQQDGAAVGAPVVPAQELPTAAPMENPGVAALFPDPPVRYDTPGLRPDRRSWTTNAELAQWLEGLSAAAGGSTRVELLRAGRTQNGLPLLALALGDARDGKTLASNGRPTVLLVGQQHGDEPASSEALLVIARELSQGLLAPMLQRINVVIVARANPDGADAGAHTSADATDLDRDHLALQTPEARAIARLVRDYRPAVVADVHEYAAQPIHTPMGELLPAQDLLVQGANTANVPEFIGKATREWYLQPLMQSLQAQGLTQEWQYTLSDSGEGLSATAGDTTPESLHNLAALSNAVGLSLASRGGAALERAHAQRRVHSLVVALTSVLKSTAERSADLLQVQSFVARDIASRACQGMLTVQAAPAVAEHQLRLLDAASGELRTLQVRWVSNQVLRPELERPRPCGYWFTQDSIAAERLGLLGLQVMRVAEEGSILAESFAGPGTAASREPLRMSIDAPAGSHYVGMNQPLANVAAAALEPSTAFSYQAKGIVPNTPGASARVLNNPSLVFEATE